MWKVATVKHRFTKVDGDCNCTERCFRHFNLNIFTEVNLLSWSRKFNHFRRISQISSCAINSILDIDPTVGDMFRSCLAEIKNAVYMEAIPLKTSQIFPYLRNKKNRPSALAYISEWSHDSRTDYWHFCKMLLNASLMLCCIYAIRDHRYIRKWTKASLSSKMADTENIINVN